MQEFSPFWTFRRRIVVNVIVRDLLVEARTAPQPVTTAPLIFKPCEIPVISFQQLKTISDISSIETGALSLTDALRSTMSTNTTVRRVVIPGSKKRKKARQDEGASTQRMSPRLRHAIIIAIILLLAIVTLVSLSPLANGQRGVPILSTIGTWVHAQQLSWQVQSHNTTVSQPRQVQNNPAPPPMPLPKSQYVAIAQQDAIAVGISPDYFVRQINAESGFNPNTVSPSGAVGIAQFLPGTAAGLGINPWDPIQALRGAAKLMASYANKYSGDYAKALAAYNGGSGTVQYAVNNCGANWLNCIPGETRNYIYKIMGV